MKHETGTYTAPDGVKLFTQHWLPPDDPKAVLFLVHGLAEHSGRYAHVAAFMVARGYAVYTMDLRGHGESPGLRGYIDRFTVYLDDLHGYLQTVKAAHPDRKVFIIGHSMGGVLSLNFTARYQSELAGMITSGAPLAAGEAVSPAVLALTKVLSTILPRLPVMALDAGTVSRDPAVREAYDNDPLNYRGKIRARLGAEIVALMDGARAGLRTITIPALAMHGGEDSLSDPASLPLIAEQIGSADLTHKLYDGLYHEIFNEPEQDEVLGDVADWLDAHA
jgi:alpha-beta hydrolase superfamily lysophospholipase